MEEASGPIGSVYKKTLPAAEIKIRERDQFWEKTEVHYLCCFCILLTTHQLAIVMVKYKFCLHYFYRKRKMTGRKQNYKARERFSRKWTKTEGREK